MEDNTDQSNLPLENNSSTNNFRRPTNNNFRQNNRNNYNVHRGNGKSNFKDNNSLFHNSNVQSFHGTPQSDSRNNETDPHHYIEPSWRRNNQFNNQHNKTTQNSSNNRTCQSGFPKYDDRIYHEKRYDNINYHNFTRRNNNQNDESQLQYQRTNDGRQKNDHRRNHHNNHRTNTNENPKIPIETAGLNQRDSLIWQLTHGKYECMICVSNIRGDTPTWSCDNCYNIFHVVCISKWANACESTATAESSVKNLRCPACQNQFSLPPLTESLYRCYCGKRANPPVARRGQLPHSCGEVCGKPSGGGGSKPQTDLCRHSCALLCHPGPCPPCDAVVTRDCHCGRTRISAKCLADVMTLVCGAVCDRLLNCGVGEHRCGRPCHAGDCDPCEVEIGQCCGCDRRNVRTVICGTEQAKEESQFCCQELCDRPLQCGHHRCQRQCHNGPCDNCRWLPELMSSCWCGKMRTDSRQSCIDSIPSCGEACGNSMKPCGHPCARPCHDGDCGPCPLSRDLPCRCGKSAPVAVQCVSIDMQSGTATIQCAKTCSKKLHCGRHRCTERCCDSQLHMCWQPCGRPLTCKQHHCESVCGHLGACPACPNVSFDELHCECGRATVLPPIACGQSPPVCSEPCSRPHACTVHPQRHNCHSDPSCPPCTELTSKPCPGGHRVLDNVPCFRPVATCGLVCGRPLSRCAHSCNRICHQDDCLSDTAVCSQPCVLPRSDCGHPCAAPCCNHDNDNQLSDCQSIMSPCTFQLVLDCACKTKSVAISCSKLQSAISFMKLFNGHDTKQRDNLELIVAPTDGAVSLACDSECRKVARNVRLADAFDVSITTSNLSTYYSVSLKNYAKKNVDFLMYVEKTLLDLAKNTRNAVDLIHTLTIKNLNEEKTDFISRYAACFKIQCKCAFNQAHKMSVTIEVNRATCCLPKPLLSDLLKTECPQLFPSKIDEEKSKFAVSSTVGASATTTLTMSFADRIRLSNKE